MNGWQAIRQLAYLIRSRVWTGTSAKVFGRVLLASRVDDDEDLGLGNLPLCILRLGSARSDPEFGEEPDLLSHDAIARLIVAVEADPTGEGSLVGSNYGLSLVTSAGAGLLQVEREFFLAARRLQDVDGVRCFVKATSAAETQRVQGSAAVIALREYRLEMLVGTEPFYHPGTRLAATAPGGGQAALTWTLPPDRFDRYRVVLRRAAGATPPTSITGGTGITLSGNLATSVTDTPGVGAFSYALFATYDETTATPDSDDQVSASDTVTITAT